MIGLARSSLHYLPIRTDDEELRLALIRLAKQYGRYGYRKITELLRIEGWKINHERVERLWREEGLQLPQRHIEEGQKSIQWIDCPTKAPTALLQG
ncbi:MAG: IS3 family transposase [Pseudomonadota bacterium]